MSGIPAEKFLTSADAPRDDGGFVSFLKDRKVVYLVFVRKEGSTPARLFPDLDYGVDTDTFEVVSNGHAQFLPTNIWIYRVKTAGPSPEP
jgi:hypothetical protein